MRARDLPAVRAFRATLAALENAEAVSSPVAAAEGSSEEIALATVGVGTSETSRRRLCDADERAVVLAEIADLRSAAAAYVDAGHPDRAADLTAGADALDALLS